MKHDDRKLCLMLSEFGENPAHIAKLEARAKGKFRRDRRLTTSRKAPPIMCPSLPLDNTTHGRRTCGSTKRPVEVRVVVAPQPEPGASLYRRRTLPRPLRYASSRLPMPTAESADCPDLVCPFAPPSH
jgi:hypothetical protein